MFELVIELKLHGRPLKAGDSLLYLEGSGDSGGSEWVAVKVVEVSAGLLPACTHCYRITLRWPNNAQAVVHVRSDAAERMAWDREEADRLDRLRALRDQLLDEVSEKTLPQDYYYIVEYLKTGDPGVLSPSARARLVDRVSGLERIAPEKVVKRHK